jgi:cell division protein FtsI/penicillin-binding protein 2
MPGDIVLRGLRTETSRWVAFDWRNQDPGAGTQHPAPGPRLRWFAAAMAFWGAFILFQLIHLQVIRHAYYARKARHQQEQEIPIPSLRGAIFDRNGRVLAESEFMDSVYINPLQVPDRRVAAELISGVLHLDRATLYNRMQWCFEHEKGFMWIARKIPADQAKRLRSLKLNWIEFTKESQRHYPEDRQAAHVVGSVDSAGKGNCGLEKSLESELHGVPGVMRVLADAVGRVIDSKVERQPHDGAAITLSIDERIQFTAQTEIARAVQEAHAESGSVVVMEPYHGEILAMASYPEFDPTRPPARGESPALRFNHAISVPFEPGSVFKVITLSAALETTDLRPDSLINCGNGTLTLFGRTVHEAHHGYGIIPMAMVLAKSSNIGAIQIGRRVGRDKLYEYVRRFGFGARTGTPLPAESPGIVRKLSHWQDTSLMSVAMGHEVGVTTIQLARALTAVANGGLLVRPRLILREGSQPVPLAPPRRILKPQTAITMRHMMEGVVLFGTGRRAKLEGYSTGGKTGSAQIFDYATRHYTHHYNASFMGFAPVTNPAIVVVVTVNGTTGTAGYGGVVAAPVFHDVATEALRILDVPKDLPDEPPSTVPVTQVAELDDAPAPELDAQEASVLQTAATDSAPVPPAPAAPASAEPPGPKVPNFEGLSMRAAVTLAEAQGIDLVLVGDGMARAQLPPPGSDLHPGERIRVEFVK